MSLSLLNLKLKCCVLYKTKQAAIHVGSKNRSKNEGFNRSECLCKGQIFFLCMESPAQMAGVVLWLKCFKLTPSSAQWKNGRKRDIFWEFACKTWVPTPNLTALLLPLSACLLILTADGLEIQRFLQQLWE